MHTVLSCVILDNPERGSEVNNALRKFLYVKVIGLFQEPIQAKIAIIRQKPDIVIFGEEIISRDKFRLPDLGAYKPDVIVMRDPKGERNHKLQGLNTFNVPYDSFENSVFPNFDKILKSKSSQQSVQLHARKNIPHVFIKSDGIYLRLSFDEIDYIKAYGEYVKIHKDGKWSLASCTMKSLEEKLPQRLFCRVHKSYIVRLDRIESFDSTHLRLLDTVIPIGRGHKVQFEKAITKIS